MLNKPSIAILIDCWDSGVTDREIYDNILRFISSNDNIEAVVLASYECVDPDELKTIWYTNYLKMFSLLTTDERLHQMYAYRKEWERVLPNELHQHTESCILHYIDKTKHQISLIFFEELEYYLSKNRQIENIFVLGEAWDGCVRDRPLGYKHLTKIQNSSILTKNDCVKTMNGDFPDLSQDDEWEEVSEGIYVLGNKFEKVVDN